MIDERDLAPEGEGTIERLGGQFGAFWQRLAPLSVGAVTGGLIIIGATSLLRRVLGARPARALSWGGALALIPLGLWLLSQGDAAEPGEPDDGAGE
ncbi:MAG: hypothetical protein JSU87_14725 [Gemmatimonadota bacterium]|nr:MAG: hypothetical protein JSU87_14725 [Gemmatimonadota bacterium]